ncbi:BTAD domain-containing putative transcriptional regulator [Meiothermus sp.]|uniref:ATP-binding protein n=1 Tax=Meiothermus sp. TaxID=1955249 RepID=UPI0021DCA818|nr:BTAD domain-containing putative transcriptional regulator [Meiothermus sp.]GIW23830.1 MAG: transcriptional activator [Meiothermus sp.]
MLQIELLGFPRITREGQEVSLPRKAVALLAYLALEGDQPRSRLVGLLWGSQAETEARHSLRQVLYQIGKSSAGPHLRAARERLGLEDFWLDVQVFRERVEKQDWPPALALYRGTLLEGFELGEEGFALWLEEWRERLGRLWAKAQEGRAGALLASGQTPAALEHYLELIRHDPLQEHFHREAMRLYAALGQTEAALGQYRRLCEVLQQELALEPLPETQALAEQIRRRKAAPQVQPKASQGPFLYPPLVGREAALEQLEVAWQAGSILLIAGPAGVGKTRLAQAFLADKGPCTVLEGQPGDGPTPYASMTRWLHRALDTNPEASLKSWVRLEASRLVPGLSDTPPPPLDEAGQMRFFAALRELLTLAGSPVFLSEDAHYSDPWSLRALAAGLGGARLIATFRPDELAPEVAQRYQDWRQSQAALWLELEPLNEPQVAELVARLSGRPAQLFPRRLYQATGGNPLFVVETLRGLFESGALRLGEGDIWETPYDETTHDYAELPIAPSVRQTILRRLERQGAAVGRCLEVAALVADGSFDCTLLSEATALSDWEVSEALEQARRARLIDPAPEGYRFSHDLMARTIAEALGPDRRRLISARLARHYAGRGAHPARVAGYFEAAGQPQEAVGWWLQAAQQAHDLRAFCEADGYYRQALEAMPSGHPRRFEAASRRFYLGRQVGLCSPEAQLEQLEGLQQMAQTALEQAQVWFFRSMALDDRHDLTGALEASRQAYRYALQVSAAEAFYPLVFVTHYQRDLGLLEEAHQGGLEALQLAQSLTPYHQIEALLCHSLTLMLSGQPETALAHVAQAEAQMQRHSPAPSSFWLLQERVGGARARVLNSLGRFDEAAAQVEALVEKSRQAGVQRQELAALLVRAQAWLGQGQTAQATADLERALALSEALHWGGAEVRQLYAELELRQQNPKAALRLAQQALEAAQTEAQQINALYSRGGAWLALGAFKNARADLEQALTLHESRPRLQCVSEQALRTRLAMTME